MSVRISGYDRGEFSMSLVQHPRSQRWTLRVSKPGDMGITETYETREEAEDEAAMIAASCVTHWL